jgi:hypothetical protein
MDEQDLLKEKPRKFSQQKEIKVVKELNRFFNSHDRGKRGVIKKRFKGIAAVSREDKKRRKK